MDARLAMIIFLLITLLQLCVCGIPPNRPREGVLVGDLTCEGLSDPQGIDAVRPRLSWILRSEERGERQTAYQILVASSESLLAVEEGDVWNSGFVTSDQSVNILYAGVRVVSGKQYLWKVRVWDKEGEPSAWSPAGRWSMGLLDSTDWRGKWIGRDDIDTTFHLSDAYWIWFPEGEPEKSAPAGVRYFRHVATLPQRRKVQDARLYFVGDNECSLYLNGMLVPSTHGHPIVSHVDVTRLVHGGSNVIAASVRNAGHDPSPAGFIALLRIRYADGTSTDIITDADWRASNYEIAGWNSRRPSGEGRWHPAKVVGRAGCEPWGEMYTYSERRLPARWLRKEFVLVKPAMRATVYFCGLGLSELFLNGEKVGDHVLSPPLSEYPRRVFYVTHDVTRLLKRGPNAVGAILGNGRFYAPRLREPTTTRSYGYPKMLFQLHIEFIDGTSEVVVSDETWTLTVDGPIRANNEYDGEEYDARKELGRWTSPGFDDTRWEVASAVAAPGGALRAPMLDPIRVTETRTPVSVTEVRPGVFIFDMGQNIVGWCRLRVNGPAGTRVTMRHAETLWPTGDLNVANLRGAKATDHYTLKGTGTEVYEPRFTYHGFRYVEVTGYPGRPDRSALEGRVVNDDLKSAGSFDCSNPIINRTYQNILWGVKGNYKSIPMDCPQRDERQGWLGDRSAESRGETYLFKVGALYAKWLQDIVDGQKENGSVSDVCPAYWPLYRDNVTWPSSLVIIPGALLDQYGDSALILRQYGAMAGWVDRMSTYFENRIIARDDYGDWCVPPPRDTAVLLLRTAPTLLATTFFYHDLCLMARYAALGGDTIDQLYYQASAARLKESFFKKFFDQARGYFDNGSQTSCILPLAFDMTPPGQRGRVFDRLVQQITEGTKRHVGTGLVGGQWLNRVLAGNGRPDLAYTLATNTTYPSWGYMAEQGATTIWELWNGDTAGPDMNSGNHVMLIGDLVIWLYEGLAGIKSDVGNPGFKRITMSPTPVGDLTFVKASHDSPYGLIRSEWKRSGTAFEWNVTVPANASAILCIPAQDEESVTENGREAGDAEGVRFLRMGEGKAIFEVGSGDYVFHSTIP